MAELLDFLLEPWSTGLGRRALVEVVLLGAFAGALSFWVVTFGLAYGVESLAHGLLPGLVAAALLGAPLFAGALAGAVVAAALIGAATREERVGGDAGTAVAVTGLLGLGGLLALLPGVPPRLGEILFGSPLSAGALELAAAGALAAGGSLALALLHRPLAAVAFGPDTARSLGLRPGRVVAALMLLTGVTVCISLQGLGNLLVLALLVAPAVAVRRLARSPLAAMVGGAAVASGCGVAGLYASFHLELAAGASVALALCLAAALGSVLAARRARGG